MSRAVEMMSFAVLDFKLPLGRCALAGTKSACLAFKVFALAGFTLTDFALAGFALAGFTLAYVLTTAGFGGKGVLWISLGAAGLLIVAILGAAGLGAEVAAFEVADFLCFTGTRLTALDVIYVA